MSVGAGARPCPGGAVPGVLSGRGAFTAYTSGIGTAALTGAVVLTAVMLLVLVTLRRLPAGTEAPANEEPEVETPASQAVRP